MQISAGPDPTTPATVLDPEGRPASARSVRPDGAGAGRRQPRSRTVSVLLPVVVGLVLGPVDLLLQRVLPYPFANLANSPAVWGLVAFVVGWSTRSRARWWPAAAATLAMLLAVESYYLAAVVALGDDVSTMTNGAARLWLALAVGSGVVLGTAGSWARSGHVWRGPLGTAAVVGVFLAEAVLDLFRATQDDAAYRIDQTQTAVVLLVVAAVVAVVAARSARQRLVGAALAVGVAAVGALVLGLL